MRLFQPIDADVKLAQSRGLTHGLPEGSSIVNTKRLPADALQL